MKRNRKKTGRVVTWQRIREIDTRSPCGEGSPYWDWVKKYERKNEDGEIFGFAIANPDTLTDYDDDYEKRRLYYQDLLEEVYAVFSPKEKQVFELLAKGHKEIEIAELLNISQPRISQCRMQIRKKLDRYHYKNPY